MNKWTHISSYMSLGHVREILRNDRLRESTHQKLQSHLRCEFVALCESLSPVTRGPPNQQKDKGKNFFYHTELPLEGSLLTAFASPVLDFRAHYVTDEQGQTEKRRTISHQPVFSVNQNNSRVFSFKRRMWMEDGWSLKLSVNKGKNRRVSYVPVFPPISSKIITVSTSSSCSHSQIRTEDSYWASSTTRLITEGVGLSLAFCSCVHWWLEKRVGYEILNSG